MSDYDIFDKRGRSEWEALINEWVHSQVDRDMLKRKYLDRVCFEPLAEEFGFSVNHCQTRVKKAKAQLFKHVEI